MMNVLRSELLKLRRPGILLGIAGVIVGMTVLITLLLFTTAKPQAEILADQEAAIRSGQLSRGPAVAFETLGAPGGYAYPFMLAANVIGVVALVAFAQNLGSEYGQGTLKVLFSREPRRLRVLVGKMLAIACVIIVAVFVAFVASTIVALIVAEARGIPTDWSSGTSLADGGLLVLRVAAAALVWGAMGTMLAVLLRAAPAAIGIGIGYTLLVEGLLGFAIKEHTKWLPGQAIQAFVGWGRTVSADTAVLEAHAASALVLVYAALFVSAAAVSLASRDVQ